MKPCSVKTCLIINMQIISSEAQNSILTSSLFLNSLRGEEMKIRKRTRPTQQMWSLAHWLVEAGKSCSALAAKHRRFLLFMPGDTTPITLSVGADYLWKPFSLTWAGDVSSSRAHSVHHHTSLPQTEACSGNNQSNAQVRCDVRGIRSGVSWRVTPRLF